MSKYAKAIIAALGAGLTAPAGIVGADSTAGRLVTVALAIVTAAATYAVPNTKSAPNAR